jgi:hypothetical protein
MQERPIMRMCACCQIRWREGYEHLLFDNPFHASIAWEMTHIRL